MLGRGTSLHLQEILQNINTSYLNLPPLSFSFITLSPYYWNRLNKYHFSTYIHVYTVFVPYSSSHTFSPPSASFQWYQPPQQDLLCPLVLQFCKRKEKWNFCLFKIATLGVSLWHFHICMYYSPNWFISSIFLLSTLVPFLCCFQQV
jgi:hypothetical protein